MTNKKSKVVAQKGGVDPPPLNECPACQGSRDIKQLKEIEEVRLSVWLAKLAAGVAATVGLVTLTIFAVGLYRMQTTSVASDLGVFFLQMQEIIMAILSAGK